MTEDYYVWQVQEEDGRWGMITTYAATVGYVPLQARKGEIAQQMKGLALKHGVGSGRPVRLARFAFAEVIEQHPQL